ncbi:MAG: DUF2806 domain-containing protein [Gammaproteobacteria bacterium]|nr:DUF2806 domain-containing protein [Gammaproteobacteria bacterium]
MDIKIPAIEQLLKIVASGIGSVAGPLLARWKARSDADVARILAQGDADALVIQAKGQTTALEIITDAQLKATDALANTSTQVRTLAELKDEIELRITFQEEKRQANIQSVVSNAADLIGEKTVGQHDIDHDWVAQFFADVMDVSSVAMQKLWGKILAGEVETPGMTSLRTLSILKQMSQREAMLFERVCKFVIKDFILQDKTLTESIPEFPALAEIFLLIHYELMQTSFGLAKVFEDQDKIQLLDKDTIYHLNKEDGCKGTLEIPAHILSKSGIELYRVIEVQKSAEYLAVFKSFLKNHASGGWTLSQSNARNVAQN